MECLNVGGVGNTPLISTNEGKRMVIDWFTSTFDRIEFKVENGYVSIQESSKKYVDELFLTLTADKRFSEYDEDYGRNNYKSAIIIGEFIRIQFAGPKNVKGNRTTMIDLSGEACREFEERGGSWLGLLKLLISWDSNFSRIDAAIDDFSGKECTPYKLKSYIENYQYLTCFHDHQIIDAGNRKLKAHKGFTIYLGSGKTGQLCIYDKKLEQERKGKQVFQECWYRYEMRLTHDKAKVFVTKHLIEVLKSQDDALFGQTLKSMLYNMLDIREPELVELPNGVKVPSDSNYKRWPKVQFWVDFLDSVEKIKLVSEKNKMTIEKNRDYMARSLGKILAKLYLVDGPQLLTNQLDLISKKLLELKDKDIEAVNKYLAENNMGKVTKDDLIKISNSLISTPDEEAFNLNQFSVFRHNVDPYPDLPF